MPGTVPWRSAISPYVRTVCQWWSAPRRWAPVRVSGVTPRQQQREQTRRLLLDSAVDCLVEHGYVGTTVQRVQDRAGVSRGAVQHHFASKADLLVAALHHIADVRMESVREALASAEPGEDATRRMVGAIRSTMSGPAFTAALELWMIARTDPELREALLPAERSLGRALREVFDDAVGTDSADARVAFESLMAALRGLAVTSVLRDDEETAAAILDYWIDHMSPS
jgi:AcrR family transcriptional regulator